MRFRSTATPLALHIVSLAIFSAAAVALSWPLAAVLDSSIPGAAGDNLAFLWNGWWMRMALASQDLDFFATNFLFAPFGVNLTLHTHTALPVWFAATVFGSLSVVTAQNVVVLVSLALNGFCAYLLAWDRVRVWSSAVLAGAIFGGSSYITTHLLGHYNLICAWGIPIFLLCLLRAFDRRSRVASLGAGLALVITAYCDYYYLVYEVLLALGLLVASLLPVRPSAAFRRPPQMASAPWSVATRMLAALLALDLLLVVLIMASGGLTFAIAGVPVSAKRPTNLLAFGWLLALLTVLSRGRPSIRLPRFEAAMLGERWRTLWPGVVVAGAGLVPLMVGGWTLWRRGDYTAPSFSWRGAPAGVDLATLLLGNPSNSWMGEWVRSVYDTLGIDRMESSAWIGVVPLAATVWAARERWRGAAHQVNAGETGRWLVVLGLSFIWALGPWLHVGGFNAGLLLPQQLATFLPIVSNARIPGRAMVVVVLASAMVVASLLARVPARRRGWITALGLAVVAVDAWAAPFPVTVIRVPALYERLRDLPPGAVCELPTGIRDGLGRRGQFDERVMTYQMIHGHPLVGGFAARVPASILEAYAHFPVLRSLLALSDGREPDALDLTLTPDAVAGALQQAAVRYVVLDRAAAPAPLVAFVERSLPLRLVATEGARELYVVKLAGEL